jgi:hypothetical protein
MHPSRVSPDSPLLAGSYGRLALSFDSRKATMTDEPRESGFTRRRLIKTSIAGSLAAPILFGERPADAVAALDQLKAVPVYFPRPQPTLDISTLTGKLAVVTGASWGGRTGDGGGTG